MDITLDVNNYKLNVRAAGVMIHNGKILVHRNVNSDHYALIGGRVEIGENSVDTIKREIKEKFDAFTRDVRNQLGELEKFFNREYFSGKIDLGGKFEDYVKSKPEVAAKIDNISKSLQKSAQEFMASLVPYIAR